MENRISNKQQVWADDIKLRIRILKNGFVEKCNDLDSEDTQKLLSKVDRLLECKKIYYIIDEFKGISDDFLVQMFDLDNKKFCNMFRSLFNTRGLLYQIQQKERINKQHKLKEIFRKYSK